MDNSHQWFPVALLSKLSQSPQRIVLCEEPIVVYKGISGWVVQKDSCPHRNYPLSAGKVKNGQLRCGYHGWQFDNQGFVTTIPGITKEYKAKCSMLKTYNSREHEGLLWVCLSPNISFYPETKPLPKRKIFSYRTMIEGDITDILENFLDPMHTSFIHDGLIRSSGKPNKTKAVIRAIPDGVEVKYTEESHQSGIIGKIFGRFITHSYGRLSKGNIIDLEFYSNKGLEMTNRFIIVPIRPGENYFFSQITASNRWFPSWIKVAVLGPLFYVALRQDKKAIKRVYDNKNLMEQAPIQSTYLDIMRPYIEQVLTNKEIKVIEKDIELYI